MITRAQIPRIVGHPVYDPRGRKIGPAKHMYLDDMTGEPVWVTVRAGFFGTHETFVPIGGARLVEDHLEVPFDKGKVKSAPTVALDDQGHLSADQERRLYGYYGLETGEQPPADSEGVGAAGAPGRAPGTEEETGKRQAQGMSGSEAGVGTGGGPGEPQPPTGTTPGVGAQQAGGDQGPETGTEAQRAGGGQGPETGTATEAPQAGGTQAPNTGAGTQAEPSGGQGPNTGTGTGTEAQQPGGGPAPDTPTDTQAAPSRDKGPRAGTDPEGINWSGTCSTRDAPGRNRRGTEQAAEGGGSGRKATHETGGGSGPAMPHADRSPGSATFAVGSGGDARRIAPGGGTRTPGEQHPEGSETKPEDHP